ncbi:MAG TPA: hypothetical protein PLK99_05615, partial [Burkholderiales bacterium]|nr:hypothetical protein [Burkholderiales bacterium]
SGQGCRIYADRPGVCRKFRCTLLISCDEKKISFAEARRKIFQARSLISEMWQTLRRVEPGLPEASLAEVWNQWTGKAKSREGADFRKKYGQALLQLAALRFFLEMHFLEKTTKPPFSRADGS